MRKENVTFKRKNRYTVQPLFIVRRNKHSGRSDTECKLCRVENKRTSISRQSVQRTLGPLIYCANFPLLCWHLFTFGMRFADKCYLPRFFIFSRVFITQCMFLIPCIQEQSREVKIYNEIISQIIQICHFFVHLSVLFCKL